MHGIHNQGKEQMCSVSQRKRAEEGNAAFSIYASKRDPQMFIHSEYVKLAGIQVFCVLSHSQYFSIGLIPDNL